MDQFMTKPVKMDELKEVLTYLSWILYKVVKVGSKLSHRFHIFFQTYQYFNLLSYNWETKQTKFEPRISMNDHVLNFLVRNLPTY